MKIQTLMNAVLAFFALISLAFAAEKVVYEVSAENSKIYLGNKSSFTAPCVVTASSVLDQIPSYKEAQKQPQGSAKRMHLMKKASDEFRSWISKVAGEKKHDLVVEVGGVTGIDANKKNVEIPNITDDVIAAITQK